METEYLKRWRMALGGNAADGTGVTLTVEGQRLDSSLEAVYDNDRRGGLGSSAPKVSRWLGDIREFFPQTVVQVIQRDAMFCAHGRTPHCLPLHLAEFKFSISIKRSFFKFCLM